MENALKSLKNAESRAAELEAHVAKKSSELVNDAEASAKKMEAEVEGKAKADGERHLAGKVESAKAESSKVRQKAKAEGDELEKRAKEKMIVGVDHVVDAVIKRMKSDA